MAQIKNRRRKSLTIFLAALLTMAGAGVAFAYWTASGTGVGGATTGETVALVVTSTPGVGELAPGSAGQTVAFTVTNPGPGVQTFTSMAVRTGEANGDPWVPEGDCLAGDYVTTITTAPVYGEMAANASLTGVATVTLTNTAVNQDDCQGQAVPLYFTAGVLPTP